MSMTESVAQSFETARESSSEACTPRPQQYDLQDEKKAKRSSDENIPPEGDGERSSIGIPQRDVNMMSAMKNKRLRNTRTSQTQGPESTEAVAMEQADVIAALIESLQTGSLDLQAAASRNTSVRSFETLQPVPTPHGILGPSLTRRSRRMSAYSTQSSKSSKTMGSSQSDNKSLRPTTLHSRGASDHTPRAGSHKTVQGSRSYDTLPHCRGEKKGFEHDQRVAPLPVVLSPHPMDSPEEQRLQQPKYPPPAKLAVISISLYICIFLVALDRTIIGPAIPEITNQFNSIEDIGWYGSAYMLTACGFILFYGQVYKFFPTKSVFLSSILIFEAGSAICGAAPSSMVLIIGRGVAGLGSSGLYTGVVLIITHIVPLHRRPLFMALFGVCFGVASVAGPLLGGAFTGSKLTWRFCFYINLPLGAISIASVVFFCHLQEKKEEVGWKKTLQRLDPVGTLLFLPSIVALLLALEWGAAEYEWSNPRIIALLVVFGVLFLLFIAWQYATRHTTATITPNVLFQRSIAFGCISQFSVGASMLTCALYIPTWFQAIKGVDAMESGIRTIPLVLSVVVASISSGIAVRKIGYYTPFMILGGILLPIGAGLITTWNTHSGIGSWLGYQAIFGLGVGFTMQHPNLAAQIVLKKEDLPMGTALLSLFQTFGGALFASVGQNLFIDKFINGLRDIGSTHPEKFVKTGATAIKDIIPPGKEDAVLEAYNNALTQGPFFACLIVGCLAFPAALGMEWRSSKGDVGKQPPTPPPPGQTASAPPDQEAVYEAKGQQGPSSTDLQCNVTETNEEQQSAPTSPASQIKRRSTIKRTAEYSRHLVQKLNPDLDLESNKRAFSHLSESSVPQRKT